MEYSPNRAVFRDDTKKQKSRGEANMSDLLVVRSKIKECTTCNVSGDFADALSKKVQAMIKEAERRAKDNNRSTIKPKDL